MTGRILALSSALLALTFVVSCSQTPQLSSIVVTPTSATIPNAGSTAQFQATGTFLNGKNGGANMQNLTDQVTWTSSVSSVATINSTGLATATGEGTTTITATGGNGGVTGTATLTVSSSATGNLTSLTVLPVNQTVPSASQTVQYIAIGTFTGTQADAGPDQPGDMVVERCDRCNRYCHRTGHDGWHLRARTCNYHHSSFVHVYRNRP